MANSHALRSVLTRSPFQPATVTYLPPGPDGTRGTLVSAPNPCNIAPVVRAPTPQILQPLLELEASSAPVPGGPVSLLGSTLAQLEQFAVDSGEPRFRGLQISEWVFDKRATSFDEMTNLPKTLRQALQRQFTMARPSITSLERAADGTRKYLFQSQDGASYEAVFIPEVASGRKTNTLCISSQTGCAVGCKFCFTASLRRNRNLAASEIVGQVLAAQENLEEDSDYRITNIVFMGMGEPLLNYNEVLQAIRVLQEPKGLGLGSRRITVSTSGIVPRIAQLGADTQVQLAISLNATTDAVRTQIMPINKKWPIAELIKTLRAYPLPPRRRFTIEYVLLKDMNDSPEDAKRLVKLLAGLPVKVNLLPLNAHDRTPYETPADHVVDAFQDILRQAKMNTLVRRARGQEISAACGQLGESASAAS